MVTESQRRHGPYSRILTLQISLLTGLSSGVATVGSILLRDFEEVQATIKRMLPTRGTADTLNVKTENGSFLSVGPCTVPIDMLSKPIPKHP